MTEKTCAHITAIIKEIEDNPLVRIATDEGDTEAYEIVRRIERKLSRGVVKQGVSP
jgi:hypothetical protein